MQEQTMLHVRIYRLLLIRVPDRIVDQSCQLVMAVKAVWSSSTPAADERAVFSRSKKKMWSSRVTMFLAPRSPWQTPARCMFSSCC